MAHQRGNVMPTRPPVHRPPGIANARERRLLFDRQRGQSEARQAYGTARWKRKREQQLTDEPLCVICLKAGRLTPATVADHVEPHRGDMDRFWNGPLQSLCDAAPWRCHSSVKQREENAGV